MCLMNTMASFLTLVIVIFSFGYSNSEINYNNRPIVGILMQEVPDSILDILPDKNYSSFIDACYIKYIESAGARVVPIFTGQDDSYHEDIASYVNGILFPGGDVSITNSSGYGMAGQKLYDLTLKANHEGNYLPVWGTCLGLEMILYLGDQQNNWLTHCEAENKADPVFSKPGHEDSRLISQMPERVKISLESENTTVNFHEFCLTQENFTSSTLSEEYEILATSFDRNDLEYAALIEHRELPIFASQFHPEMVLFQWPDDHRHDRIPHTYEAVEVSQYLANFFVNQTRPSHQDFPTLAEEEDSLIYNYQTAFTGVPGMIYTEVYLLP